MSSSFTTLHHIILVCHIFKPSERSKPRKKYPLTKHVDTLEFYKKALSLQKDYYNLKHESLSIKYHQNLYESESNFQSFILELVRENENCKHKLLQIDKTIGS